MVPGMDHSTWGNVVSSDGLRAPRTTPHSRRRGALLNQNYRVGSLSHAPQLFYNLKCGLSWVYVAGAGKDAPIDAQEMTGDAPSLKGSTSPTNVQESLFISTDDNGK